MSKELKWESYEDMLKRKEKSDAKKKAKTIKVVYSEPADYIPKDLRQKYKEDAERYTYMVSPSRFVTEKYKSCMSLPLLLLSFFFYKFFYNVKCFF